MENPEAKTMSHLILMKTTMSDRTSLKNMLEKESRLDKLYFVSDSLFDFCVEGRFETLEAVDDFVRSLREKYPLLNHVHYPISEFINLAQKREKGRQHIYSVINSHHLTIYHMKKTTTFPKFLQKLKTTFSLQETTTAPKINPVKCFTNEEMNVEVTLFTKDEDIVLSILGENRSKLGTFITQNSTYKK